MLLKVLVLILVTLDTSNAQICNFPDMNKPVTIGDNVVVCLHFKVETQLKRIAYRVKVDMYTALKSPGVYQAVRVPNTLQNISINLQFKNHTVNAEYLASTDVQYVANMFSFIIRTNKGVVEEIQSENDVFYSGCNGLSSLIENCFKKPSDTTTDNDPKIFLSWIGTDSSGNYLLSQTKRLSRFTKYSVTDAYAQALKLFNL